MSVTVIRKDALPPVKHVFLGGCAYGLLSLLTMFLGGVFVASSDLSSLPPLVPTVAFLTVIAVVALVPFIAAYGHRRRIVTCHRAGLAAVGFLLGFAGVIEAGFAANYIAGGMTEGWQQAAAICLGGPFAAYAAGAITWLAIRILTGPYIYGAPDDCPGCGYKLVNCGSDRCPECGKKIEKSLVDISPFVPAA